MDIAPRPSKGKQLIEAYGDNGFRVAGQNYKGSLLIWPDQVLPWNVFAFDQVRISDFQGIFDITPAVEILLFGVGQEMRLPPPDLRQAMRQARIAFDCMDTGAACRTYNVLMAEDRRVAAALIAV